MSDASARARPDWLPAAAPTTPTPSMLAYAFGERIAPPAGRFGGKVIPCSGRMVDSDELAVTMLHVALWDLERREVVTLRESVEPGSNDARTFVRPAPRAPLEREFGASLEYLLFRSARSGREDRDVGEVVGHLFPHPMADPFAYVFELENEAMLQARLMRRDVEGRVAVPGFERAGQNRLVWLCEQVGQHIVGFTTTQAEWERYRAADADGCERVHRAIRAAIESRWDRSADEETGA